MKYDVIIVGAGPAGIFTALEMMRHSPKKRILIIEKGNRIEKRVCPKRTTGKCSGCTPCNITTGFSGAGAFSDGKLILTPLVGGDLIEHIGEEKLWELIGYVDGIYLSYGADPKIYGEDLAGVINDLKQRAIQSNLKLIEYRIRHMGTEKSYEIYSKIQKDLIDSGVEILFNTQVKDLITEGKAVKGVVADREYYSDTVVVAVGRDGAEWIRGICDRYGLTTEIGGVDIGVRVEVRDEIMREINETIYESKLIYYTPTFDDRVRTFCHNPSGVVASEYYDNSLAVVNGHSYKAREFKSENTNFAILVSNYFTDPFKEPLEYAKSVARMGNLLSGNKIIVQRFGDFKRGRRTNAARLVRNNIRPTLVDAVPGDLSLVLPYRIMLDIKEMLEALDNIFPGLASDETLLYGVEVKFYSEKILVDGDFRTVLRGLYAAGDGAGLTRGLVQSSINGILIGRALLKAERQ